ncbi:MAG: hypothetical protein ACREXW_15495 [Gammaproteobacteria bacterium]
MSIPTGQGVAQALGVTPLTEAELRQGNSDAFNDALEHGGFLQKTPLWYYVLKEAEVRADGNSLSEVGSASCASRLSACSSMIDTPS